MVYLRTSKASPSQTLFNGAGAHAHHIYISRHPRYIASAYYNYTADYITTVLSRTTLNVTHQYGDVAHLLPTKVNHIERRIHNIIATRESTEESIPSLLISAHFDSHAQTPGAYDDSIHVAVMLELATCLNTTSYPLTLVFLGSEEHGLHGSELFMRNSDRCSGNVLNLESMGTGPRLV
jgi:Iap family predicted aminopeptidase